LELEKFQVSLPVIRMLFKAPPGTTTKLCYGNANAIAPGYDLDLVAAPILAAARSDATLADADPTGPPQWRPSNRSPSLVFFAVLALVVTGLVVIIVRLLPKPASPT
jgi:hypothetical protein